VLFRIAQEAITNVVRHADASHVEIRLESEPNETRLSIVDNGGGFDVGSALKYTDRDPCWGLLGMKERAALVGGECQVISHVGLGTQVLVRIPMEERVHA
jgi:signal transduction histidine kinase